MGICLIADRSAEMYYEVLDYFFSIMNYGYPSSIVTKDLPDLIEALDKLNLQNPEQKRWIQILDWKAKLKEIREKLKEKKFNDEQIADFIKWFGQMLAVPNKNKFNKLLEQNKVHMIDDKLIEDFKKKKEQYCFAFFDKKFHGFSPSTNRNDKYNIIMKRHFKPGKNFARFFYDLIKYESTQIPIEIDNRPNKPVSLKKGRYVELKDIEDQMYSELFDKLVEAFSSVIDMDATRKDDATY